MSLQETTAATGVASLTPAQQIQLLQQLQQTQQLGQLQAPQLQQQLQHLAQISQPTQQGTLSSMVPMYSMGGQVPPQASVLPMASAGVLGMNPMNPAIALQPQAPMLVSSTSFMDAVSALSGSTPTLSSASVAMPQHQQHAVQQVNPKQLNRILKRRQDRANLEQNQALVYRAKQVRIHSVSWDLHCFCRCSSKVCCYILVILAGHVS
eukprot:m.173968 g.173968  ORF g.173968 m.173968 type:complete len:208 (+) comp14588_c0_seq2:417-1040(+)